MKFEIRKDIELGDRNARYEYELNDRKKEYLNFLKESGELEDASIHNYMTTLYKIEFYEKIVNKEKHIEDFTNEEIIKLFKVIPFNNLVAVQNFKSRVLDFLKFCVMKNYILSVRLSVKDVLNNDLLESFVDKGKFKKYVTEKQIYEEIDNLYNAQDKAMVLLIFEGICGDMCSDLESLKKENYNPIDKTLKYIKGATGEEITLKLNDKLNSIISNMINEDTYWLSNGKEDDGNRRKNVSTELIKSDYLFETSEFVEKDVKENVEGAGLKGTTMKTRLTVTILKKYLNTNDGNLTIRSLEQSGIYNRLTKMYYIKNDFRLDEVGCYNYLEKEGFSKTTIYRYLKELKQLVEEYADDVIYLD